VVVVENDLLKSKCHNHHGYEGYKQLFKCSLKNSYHTNCYYGSLNAVYALWLCV